MKYTRERRGPCCSLEKGITVYRKFEFWYALLEIQIIVYYFINNNAIYPEILSTNERPDIVFWSVKARKVILIELTCPAEEGISAAQDRKQARYLSLISQIQERKWTVKFLTIEVGVRGFVGNSLFKCLISLGFSRSATTKLCKTVSLVSAKCSYTIFFSSDSRNWDTSQVLLGPDGN